MATPPDQASSRAKGISFLAIVFFYCFISACQAANHTEHTDFLTLVKINELKLEIYDQQGRCAIRMNNAPNNAPTSELLDIPYPCGFVRASKAPIAQTYHYQGVGQVFVVAGPLADKKDYKENAAVNFKHMCSNQGQAIIIRNSKLTLRKSQNIPLGFCHQLGFDEKDYYGFAYPVD